VYKDKTFLAIIPTRGGRKRLDGLTSDIVFTAVDSINVNKHHYIILYQLRNSLRDNVFNKRNQDLENYYRINNKIFIGK